MHVVFFMGCLLIFIICSFDQVRLFEVQFSLNNNLKGKQNDKAMVYAMVSISDMGLRIDKK